MVMDLPMITFVSILTPSAFTFSTSCCYNARLRKTELRNTVNQNAAGFVKCLKDGYIVTKFSQIACTGQSGRTGTDHSNFLAVFLCRSSRFDAVLSCPVSYETLQFTDGNSFALDAADTFALTLALLRADTAADSGKCAGLGDDAGKLLRSFLLLPAWMKSGI